MEAARACRGAAASGSRPFVSRQPVEHAPGADPRRGGSGHWQEAGPGTQERRAGRCTVPRPPDSCPAPAPATGRPDRGRKWPRRRGHGHGRTRHPATRPAGTNPRSSPPPPSRDGTWGGPHARPPPPRTRPRKAPPWRCGGTGLAGDGGAGKARRIIHQGCRGGLQDTRCPRPRNRRREAKPRGDLADLVDLVDNAASGVNKVPIPSSPSAGSPCTPGRRSIPRSRPWPTGAGAWACRTGGRRGTPSPAPRCAWP